VVLTITRPELLCDQQTSAVGLENWGGLRMLGDLT